MVFLPLHELCPGMKLAEEIVIYLDAPVVLLKKGMVLNDRYLSRLRSFDISGAYVNDGVNDDSNPPPRVISSAVRAEAMARVRDMYSAFTSGNAVQQCIAGAGKVVRNLASALANNNRTFVDISDLKSYDDCTYRHSLSVAVISMAMGLERGLDHENLCRLGLSAVLHDIGKIEIPLEVLNKPGVLSEGEYAIVKTHSMCGSAYLEKFNLAPDDVIMSVKCHHERFDGRGYPLGLAGQDIPLFSRIIAVADVYDALTAKRPYRNPMKPAEAAEYLMANCSTAFDGEMVESFLHSIEVYPVGSCVWLNDGRRCVIVKNTNTLRPVVRLLEPPYRELDLFEDRSLYNTIIAQACVEVVTAEA